jgi:dienelactone hydrolase
MTFPLSDPTKPLHEQTIRLNERVTGRAIVVPSATPRHFEAIVRGGVGAPVEHQAVLFVPPANGALTREGHHPTVIIVPGSGGVMPPLFAHARALVDAGIAALVLDPFRARSVVHTVSEQRQIPFAASVYDVFAAMRRLAHEPDIDATRLGAMGYSRGGVAVLGAAMRNLAAPSLQGQPSLRAVLAGWPWCGYQFREPDTGDTAIRLVVADLDDWASPVQSQAYEALLRAHGARVTLRLFHNAHHGFGYGVPVKRFDDAMVALNAPIVYFDHDGVMRDPWSGERRPDADDTTIVRLLGAFIGRGVTVGSLEGQMQDFIDDFTRHFATHLA